MAYCGWARVGHLDHRPEHGILDDRCFVDRESVWLVDRHVHGVGGGQRTERIEPHNFDLRDDDDIDSASDYDDLTADGDVGPKL